MSEEAPGPSPTNEEGTGSSTNTKSGITSPASPPATIEPNRPLVSLDAIGASARIVADRREPDQIDRLAERKQRAEIGTIEQANRNHRANRVLRFRYAKAVYQYLIGYSVCAFVLILTAGFKPFGFTLPETVLSLVVGSTAVAAIGLVGFVIQGLFKPAS